MGTKRSLPAAIVLASGAVLLLAPFHPPILGSLLDSFLAVPARAQASHAYAKDLVIEAGATTYRIKQLDLSGTALQSADLAALFDPKNPRSLQERLQQLDAGALTAPEVIAETKRDGYVQTVIYRNVSLNTLEAGRATAARINRTELKLAGPNGTIEGTYGAVKASGIDLTLAAQMLGANVSAGSDKTVARAPFLETLEISDVQLANQEAHSRLTIEALRARDIKAQAPATAASTEPHMAESKEAGAKGLLDKDQPAVPGAFDNLAGTLPASLDIGAMEADKLDLVLTNPQNQPLHLSFAKGAFTNYSAFTFGTVHLQDVGLQSPALAFTLQDLALRDVDFTTVRTLLREATENNTMIGLQAILPRVDQLDLAKLDVSKFGEKVPATDQDPGRDPLSFKVEHLHTERSQPFEEMPTRIDGTITHLLVDLDKNHSGLFKDLASFGYKALDLSSQLAVVWTPDKQQLNVDNVIDAKNMGKVTLSALLTNISKQFFSSKDVETTRHATEAARLKSAELTIDNDGIFDKFLSQQAQAQNKPLADLKRSYTSAAAVVVPILLGNGPGAKLIGAAVSKFIADPKKLHLLATMPDGLTLKDVDLIQTPGLLLDKIEIQVSHESQTAAPQAH